MLSAACPLSGSSACTTVIAKVISTSTTTTTITYQRTNDELWRELISAVSSFVNTASEAEYTVAHHHCRLILSVYFITSFRCVFPPPVSSCKTIPDTGCCCNCNLNRAIADAAAADNQRMNTTCYHRLHQAVTRSRPIEDSKKNRIRTSSTTTTTISSYDDDDDDGDDDGKCKITVSFCL